MGVRAKRMVYVGLGTVLALTVNRCSVQSERSMRKPLLGKTA